MPVALVGISQSSTHNNYFSPSGYIHFLVKYGAETRIRTADLLLTKQLLYQLSYFGILELELNEACMSGAAV